MAQDPWALFILETNYPSSKSVKIDGETDKVRRIVTLGARGFSCAVCGFGQVLKSDPREKRFFLAASPLESSAFGRTRVGLWPTKRNPRRTREKTSGTQGSGLFIQN